MLSQEHQISDYYYQLGGCDLVLIFFYGWFNENFMLLEFEIAVNLVGFFWSFLFSQHRELDPGNTKKQLVWAWLIAACSHWLNCNRFLQNVRKRKGLVPFNVRQMRAVGKGLCYHSYVTECGEWQGGARGLIGVNTCGVESRLSLLGNAQSMWVKRSTQQALKGSSYIYLLRWILEGIFFY